MKTPEQWAEHVFNIQRPAEEWLSTKQLVADAVRLAQAELVSDLEECRAEVERLRSIVCKPVISKPPEPPVRTQDVVLAEYEKERKFWACVGRGSLSEALFHNKMNVLAAELAAMQPKE